MTELNTIRASDLPQLTDTANGSLLATSPSKTGTLPVVEAKAEFLSSAQLTGTPTVPTPNLGDHSNRIANTAWVNNEIDDLGLDLITATPTNFGTVRTNSTESVPIVYLKSEIDNRLAAISPIDLGGTGNNTIINARANLGIAKSGENSDITSLGSVSLGDGSTAVTKATETYNRTIATTAYCDNSLKRSYVIGITSNSTTNHSLGNNWYNAHSTGNFSVAFQYESADSRSDNGEVRFPTAGTFLVNVNTNYYQQSGVVSQVSVGLRVGTANYNIANGGQFGNIGGQLIFYLAAGSTLTPIIYWSVPSGSFTGQVSACHLIIKRISF